MKKQEFKCIIAVSGTGAKIIIESTPTLFLNDEGYEMFDGPFLEDNMDKEQVGRVPNNPGLYSATIATYFSPPDDLEFFFKGDILSLSYSLAPVTGERPKRENYLTETDDINSVKVYADQIQSTIALFSSMIDGGERHSAQSRNQLMEAMDNCNILIDGKWVLSHPSGNTPLTPVINEDEENLYLQEKKARDIELKDEHWEKIMGEINPGSRVKILWDDDIIDRGYAFTLPICNPDEGNMFIHVQRPNNEFGKDTVDAVYIHLVDLLTNEHVLSITVTKPTHSLTPITDEGIEELWDDNAELIGEDIDGLQIFAGRNVITESRFKEALSKLSHPSPNAVEKTAKAFAMKILYHTNNVFKKHGGFRVFTADEALELTDYVWGKFTVEQALQSSPQEKWISVKDRLPDDERYYLFYQEASMKGWRGVILEEPHYAHVDKDCYLRRRITHWRETFIPPLDA